VEEGIISQRAAQHLRANYGSKLSMIDHWFGKLMDTIERHSLWRDTVVIVCTDHGHYLGEKDIFGKPRVPQYETLGHTPLFIAWPGQREAGRASFTEALTTNVDIYATLAELFDVTPRHATHGVSLGPLCRGEAKSVREWTLGGVWGQWVQLNDGARKYARAPVGDGFPLSMWSNRWSTMPVHALPGLRLPRPDRRARLDFMPGSEVPVIRQPFGPGDPLPFWGLAPALGEHHCYAYLDDLEEEDNRLGSADEKEMGELLRVALAAVEAPAEQLERLGLS